MKRELTLGYVNYGTGRHEPFDQVFPLSIHVNPAQIRAREIDALVIWGGEDISPSLYGELPNKYNGATQYTSRRDAIEVEVCKAAIETGIPIIGVCRGAQLLCALAGGKLVQHVDGHHGSHRITTNDGRTIITSSVHHQMMVPWGVDHHLIAWSSEPLSRKYLGENEQPVDMVVTSGLWCCEPEIVYFPKIKGLAIQGHPEFMDDKSEFVEYCNDLVNGYILE